MWVLRFVLKEAREVDWRILDGSEFQTVWVLIAERAMSERLEFFSMGFLLREIPPT